MTITSTLTASAPSPSPTLDPMDASPHSLNDDIPVFRPSTAPKRRSNVVRISPYGPSDVAAISDFERDFRLRLADLGAPVRSSVERPKRSVVTAVVTALRSGIDVDRFLGVARGLSPQAAADAYDYVFRVRAEADAALDRLIADPTPDRFAAEREVLSGYLPQMSAMLERLAGDHPESFADAVGQLADQATVLTASVDAVETLVRDDDPSWPAKLVDLDDGRNQGVYHHACYRPRRVGDIVPMRLSYLLGEATPDVRS